MPKGLTTFHIHFSYYPSQGHTGVYEYLKNLNDMGVKVNLIVPGRQTEPEYEVYDGIKIYRIPLKKVDRKDLRVVLTFNKRVKNLLAKINKEIKIDIIHVYYAPLTSIIGKFSRNLGIKCVCDLRSGPIKGGLFSKIGWKVLELELNYFDAIFVPEINILKLINPTNKLIEIPLGANFNHFTSGLVKEIRGNYGVCEEEILLIHSGTLYPTRKLDKIIKAFRDISNKYTNIKLIFVGTGPDEYRLRDLANNLKLNNIIFAGYVDYSLMPDYIRASDIGVSFIPIVDEYYFQPPLKTAEYLSSSLPTIATTTNGNRRFIKDGFNGVLVKDDTKSLKSGIEFLIDNPKARRKFQRVSRKSISEYDYKRIIERRLIPAYENILSI